MSGGWLRHLVSQSRGSGASLRPSLALPVRGTWSAGPDSPAQLAVAQPAADRPASVGGLPPSGVEQSVSTRPASPMPLAAPTLARDAQAPAAATPAWPARSPPAERAEAPAVRPVLSERSEARPSPSALAHRSAEPRPAPALRPRGESSAAPVRPSLPLRETPAMTQRPPATPEPVPDVHIHIGRIELTAITAPEPRRTAGAAQHKPMSLDDYLGRRNRGTR